MVKITRRLPKMQNITIRPLTRDELGRLHEPRAPVPQIQKIRESHHRLARLFASGLRLKDVAERSGYSYIRVQALHSDPAFQELIAHYRKMVDESFIASVDEYHDLATRNMLAAERHVADHIDQLDEAGELLPIKTALAISRDAADRFGYGKKQTNLNVNVDFAKNLEAMLRRSGKGGANGTPSPVAESPQLLALPLLSAPEPQVPTDRAQTPQQVSSPVLAEGPASLRRRA